MITDDLRKIGFMDLIERHRRFWKREPTDQPLVGTSREGVFFLQPFVELDLRDGPLAVQDIPSAEAFLPYYDKVLGGSPRDGDLFWVAKPPRAIPWMEAIAGCGVNATISSSILTAAPPAELPDLEDIDLAANPWLRLMNAFTETFSRHFSDLAPVGQTLMRGPSDMLAAMLGQQFYTGLVENPERMKTLARQCTELWIGALEAQYKRLQRYRDGYMAGIIGLWAPGTVAVYQEDAAGLISASMYRQFFFDCDAAIASAFDYSLLHLHSASLHILNPVLEIPGLSAVNVVVDQVGPGLEVLIPKLQQIQQAGKALHLQGDLSEKVIKLIQETLSPDGLCISIVRED